MFFILRNRLKITRGRSKLHGGEVEKFRVLSENPRHFANNEQTRYLDTKSGCYFRHKSGRFLLIVLPEDIKCNILCSPTDLSRCVYSEQHSVRIEGKNNTRFSDIKACFIYIYIQVSFSVKIALLSRDRTNEPIARRRQRLFFF